MKKIISYLSVSVLLCFSFINAFAYKPTQQWYELKIYHCNKNEQLTVVHQFLKESFLPLLHNKGYKNIGVFTAIDADTAVDKKIVVFIPLKNIEEVAAIDKIFYETSFINQQSNYLTAAYNQAVYQRIETVVLKAFRFMQTMQLPNLTSPKAERVYELRSYEGTTEKLYNKKVEMFNEGGEINIFSHLNFNAVFYAEVIAGSHMPNLMYMTTHNNKAERDEHWKNFGADTTWKRISNLPEYKNTVSHSDILFLRPTEYSDF